MSTNTNLKYNRMHSARTLDEACGFRDGIIFANDSALTVVGIRKHRIDPQRYDVLMWDADSAADFHTRRIAPRDLVAA
jgi:hypothetical protein